VSHIYVSYSIKDGADLALELVEALEATGSPCWIAPLDLEARVNGRGRAAHAIRESRGLVLLLTPDANNSAEVLEDLELAVKSRAPIVPVLIRSTRLDDILIRRMGISDQIVWTDAQAVAIALGKVFPPIEAAPPPSRPARTERLRLAVEAEERRQRAQQAEAAVRRKDEKARRAAMSCVFISHAVKDGADFARQLVEALEESYMRCWVAPRDMTAGADYPTQIVGAIRACHGLVLLLTPGAVESRDVLQEVQSAHKQGKVIVPLIIDGTQPSDGLDYFLGVRQQIPWTAARAMAVEVAKVFPSS
jgi:hypothetical protein